MSDWRQSTTDYRVRKVEGGFTAEMLYRCKEGLLWVPLKEDGFWADPDAYSTGQITIASVLTEEEARRAVWRAQLVNMTARMTIQKAPPDPLPTRAGEATAIRALSMGEGE